MLTYDVIVIGFGKAGKTLASKFGAQGKKVAIIEKDDTMYGGTCINIGCIPTKVLIHSIETHHGFDEAIAEKNAVVSRLRAKNFKMLDDIKTVDVFNADATFSSNKVIKIRSANGGSQELTAEIIIINTGSVINTLPIKGLTESTNVYDSTSIQNLKTQPKTLGIIGGGNIGLEFASLFSQMGTHVSIFDPQERILAREEEFVSTKIAEYMAENGVQFELQSHISEVKNDGNHVILVTENGEYEFDAVLHATGRKPNITGLGIENTDIKLTERGAIQVDEFLQTSVPKVFAVGDVNGGLQFTYISLDDSRIVWNYLKGNSDYSTKKRHNVPYTIFLNPPLSRVGIDETQAKEQGVNYQSNTLMVANMPRAHVNSDLRGFFKVIVDADSHLILGATLLSAESPELINLIKMAMDNKIPYTYLQNQIFTHPTMAENLNDLFHF
ncbi:Putative Dihydrolipoamide dehydrogenase; Mercuric ion reductase; PF00070 family, FAD-dependent NAD(P)-disulphide oxidoreductase [Streptococcus pseudoporcinus]|uniref:Dihydrolipoamide dehydrogenase Mercuric ion reductase PF00070 family, FAD-dependent NAD(P)-disulphide oxidoreductase n=1 Tax=Streptococcus pseudoporcinus TaxID=361101 RepID=A0A4U9ZMH4_9STRE|nr:FAD-containing oxidoreductase [Streptococcus pseudoporcinus]VTS40794.1 Putative Dihydrolipoamide dehydrogenase; Mercuric ion reductase; PF00070 family, FAD-dependent NAD(P)-disulphide oxidoreductase [Streptococcus pseudoporcinus]